MYAAAMYTTREYEEGVWHVIDPKGIPVPAFNPWPLNKPQAEDMASLLNKQILYRDRER